MGDLSEIEELVLFATYDLCGGVAGVEVEFDAIHARTNELLAMPKHERDDYIRRRVDECASRRMN